MAEVIFAVVAVALSLYFYFAFVDQWLDKKLDRIFAKKKRR